MSWFLILILCEGASCSATTIPAAYIKQSDCVAAGKQAVETKGIKRSFCVAYAKVQ